MEHQFKAECPDCKGDIEFVCRQIEHHHIRSLDRAGEIELICLTNSWADDSFKEYLLCPKCQQHFDLTLKKISEEEAAGDNL